MTILEDLLIGLEIEEAKKVVLDKGYRLNEIIITSGRKDQELLTDEIVISVEELKDKTLNLITTKFKTII